MPKLEFDTETSLYKEDMELTKMLSLIDLQQTFAMTPGARIVNNSELISEGNKLSKDFTNLLYSNGDGELGFVPSCQCGRVKGVVKVNLTCPTCGTVCSEQFVDSLTQNTWLSFPEVLSDVLHPVWYMILKNWTSIGRRDLSIIDIILNPDEDMPEDLAPYIKGRGFKYFKENSEYIMNVLLYEYPRTAKKALQPWMVSYYHVYGNVMFTNKLPVLHNSLHPLKGNGSSLNYVDKASTSILTAIIDLSTEAFKHHSTTVNDIASARATYRIYQNIIDYYRTLITTVIGSKPGIIRKHELGSRFNWSFRAVVVPHDSTKRLDEIILPWGVAVNLLRLPIINRLVSHHKLSVPDAYELCLFAANNYQKLVDECITHFIKSSPGGYLAIATGRNPTMAYGSEMMLRCYTVKKNPKDETLSINACIVTPANIDFDGDELYGFIVFEEWLRKAMEAIQPEQFLFSTMSAGFGSKIGLLKQNYTALEHWISSSEYCGYDRYVDEPPKP